MATTTTHQPTSSEHRQNGRPSFVAGDSEARPGLMTTEFWLTILVAIAVVVISYVDDSYSVELGWKLGVGVVAAYVISRGIAKAGSSERYVAQLRDEQPSPAARPRCSSSSPTGSAAADRCSCRS